MVTDLRAQVVEAQAKPVRQFAFDIVMNMLGLDESDTDDQVFASEIVDGWMKHWHLTGAGPALDAALDVLGERWEEWIDHTADFEGLADLPTWEHGLLAVLRAGKGSE